MSNIGQNIKNRRIELGLTADQLAERLQKSRATIYRYESTDADNMPIGILEPLAKALSTTPAELTGWNGEAVNGTTRLTFDDNSSMHALTQAYLRRPSLVQDEIIRRLKRMDATFSNNVSKLLQASGDINRFMDNTGLSFASVGKFMQGETVLTSPTEAERIATYFHADVVDLFFNDNSSSDAKSTITTKEDDKPIAHLDNLPAPIADIMYTALNSDLKNIDNVYHILVALANYLNQEEPAPSYTRTKDSLSIIRSKEFISILDKTLHKFFAENPYVTDLPTVAYLLAKKIYDKPSDVWLLCINKPKPAEILRDYLKHELNLN